MLQLVSTPLSPPPRLHPVVTEKIGVVTKIVIDVFGINSNTYMGVVTKGRGAGTFYFGSWEDTSDPPKGGRRRRDPGLTCTRPPPKVLVIIHIPSGSGSWGLLPSVSFSPTDTG